MRTTLLLLTAVSTLGSLAHAVDMYPTSEFEGGQMDYAFSPELLALQIMPAHTGQPLFIRTNAIARDTFFGNAYLTGEKLNYTWAIYTDSATNELGALLVTELNGTAAVYRCPSFSMDITEGALASQYDELVLDCQDHSPEWAGYPERTFRTISEWVYATSPFSVIGQHLLEYTGVPSVKHTLYVDSGYDASQPIHKRFTINAQSFQPAFGSISEYVFTNQTTNFVPTTPYVGDDITQVSQSLAGDGAAITMPALIDYVPGSAIGQAGYVDLQVTVPPADAGLSAAKLNAKYLLDVTAESAAGDSISLYKSTTSTSSSIFTTGAVRVPYPSYLQRGVSVITATLLDKLTSKSYTVKFGMFVMPTAPGLTAPVTVNDTTATVKSGVTVSGALSTIGTASGSKLGFSGLAVPQGTHEYALSVRTRNTATSCATTRYTVDNGGAIQTVLVDHKGAADNALRDIAVGRLRLSPAATLTIDNEGCGGSVIVDYLKINN